MGNDASLELVGEAGSGEEAVSQFRECQPDVTLMDLRLPGMNGVEAIIAIRQEFPEARIVALTTETGDAQIQRALAASAKGYLLKDMPVGDLIDIIRAVHAGKTRIPGLVATHIAEHLADRALTAREMEVLHLIAEGCRNKAVAQALSISDETVKMHVKTPWRSSTPMTGPMRLLSPFSVDLLRYKPLSRAPTPERVTLAFPISWL